MKRSSTKTLFSALAVVLFVAGCADSSPDKQLKSAKDYLQKKDTKAATIEVKNALQKNPDLAEARFLLGKAMLEGEESAGAQQAAGAQKEMRKALELNYPADQVIPLLAEAMLDNAMLKDLNSKKW